MTPSPFTAHHQHLSPALNQTLALAALFQTAQLVHVVAMAGSGKLGEQGRYFCANVLQAALNIRVDHNPNHHSLNFYHSIGHIHLGLRTLENCLASTVSTLPQSKLPAKKNKDRQQIMHYVLSLMRLSKKIYKNHLFKQKIQQTQTQLIRQLSFFDYQYTHPSILFSLAQLYKETASTTKPKIYVRGAVQVLQNEQDTALIRALLFAGLQAAHYWHNLDGSVWKLIWHKAKIVKQAQYLAKLHYLQQHFDKIV